MLSKMFLRRGGVETFWWRGTNVRIQLSSNHWCPHQLHNTEVHGYTMIVMICEVERSLLIEYSNGIIKLMPAEDEEDD